MTTAPSWWIWINVPGARTNLALSLIFSFIFTCLAFVYYYNKINQLRLIVEQLSWFDLWCDHMTSDFFVSSVHRVKSNTTAPPVACNYTSQAAGHAHFCQIQRDTFPYREGLLSAFQSFQNTWRSQNRLITLPKLVCLFIYKSNGSIIAGAATEAEIMFQKRKKNRPFDHLDITSVHFLLHLRKETRWEM